MKDENGACLAVMDDHKACLSWMNGWARRLPVVDEWMGAEPACHG